LVDEQKFKSDFDSKLTKFKSDLDSNTNLNSAEKKRIKDQVDAKIK